MSASGKNSKSWKGTSGSPQTSTENSDYEDLSKDDLTPAQAKAIRKVENSIRDHLDSRHLEAAKRELNGNPILRKNGIPYNHLKESKKAIRGLEKGKKSILNSLKDPNLSQKAKHKLLDEIKQISKALNYWNIIHKGELK